MSDIQGNSAIGLTEFINKLKDELSLVEQDSKVFVIEKVELEIQVTAARKTSGDVNVGGKLDLEINVVPLLPSLKVGELNAEGKVSREITRQDVHTVKLSLTPAAFKPELVAMLDDNEKRQLTKDTKDRLFLGSKDPKSQDPI